jgi:formate hydrogenlyase subunit 4
MVGLAAMIAAAALLPVGTTGAVFAFSGDLVLFAYLLGLARLFTVLAALDTGSAFEGMGASREVQFSALAEPALLLGLAAVARQESTFSLTRLVAGVTPELWMAAAPQLALVAAALFVVFLAENARIPVDDPNTHLELTMIHEVMVLDHGGPDFGFIQYASSLKLWVLGSLVVAIAVPVRTGHPLQDGAAFVAGMMAIAILTGIVESCMARLRLVRVPQLLVSATALSLLALLLVLNG